ncbi:MAG: radical SAM protein [Candidatus Zixiibacteriota bacterium]
MLKEVFLLDDQSRIALFAPLKGLIMEVKEGEKDKVSQLIDQPHFSFGHLTNIFPEIERNRLFQEKPKDRDSPEKEGEFSPDSVVLFTTLDCNLRCIYCYSKGGEQSVNMTWQIAEKAIDFVIRNAKLKEQEESFLEFHGGGEPTRNWSIFQSALEYFQQRAQENSLTPKVSLATNGMLSTKQIDWIASRINSVQVSLDGMEEIQNFQRPTVSGGASFAVVYNTVTSFLAKKIQVTIHCVITERSVHRIPEIIHFFIANFPDTTIHLEPACECGRGLQMGQRFPSPELFISGFIEAEKLAETFGVELFYSGAGPRLGEFHQGFCGVSSPNFVVTPAGLVTACHEVAEEKHPLANYFIYGYLDHQDTNFVFDYEKIKNLRSYTTDVNSSCKGCFAQYYCAGDCLTKSLNNNHGRKTPLLNPRCEINRALMKYYVFKKLFMNEKEDYHERTSR